MRPIKAGRLTVRQLVQGYLDRIETYDQTRGRTSISVITINPDALGGSRQARRRL